MLFTQCQLDFGGYLVRISYITICLHIYSFHLYEFEFVLFGFDSAAAISPGETEFAFFSISVGNIFSDCSGYFIQGDIAMQYLLYLIDILSLAGGSIEHRRPVRFLC